MASPSHEIPPRSARKCSSAIIAAIKRLPTDRVATAIALSAIAAHGMSGCGTGPRKFCQFRIATSSSRCLENWLHWLFKTRGWFYGILFRAVAEALLEMAADPKRLGAKLGFLAVLHTWNQRLEAHPHIHCVVPAGGLSPNGKCWISPWKKDFFLPVKPLSRLFRRKFLTHLQEAFVSGSLGFHGSLSQLAHPTHFTDWVESLKQKEWVTYVKPPFGGPEQVLGYLARYTHRIAISNGRLLGLEGGRVRFRWRDSKDHNQIKEISLDAVEFIRRFLLHVLGDMIKVPGKIDKKAA